MTKSLGKKTVNFDINGIAAGVNMEVLKISKPIVSAGKMVRSGAGSFWMTTTPLRTRKTEKRISVQLTRGDVFEISAYMSPNSHGLPKRPVLICPNEVEEAEDPGHEELDESMPEPDVVPSVCQMIALSSKSCQKKQFPRATRVWCFGGVAQSSASTNSRVATRRRRSIWVNRWYYSSVRAVACEKRHLAVEQISAQTEWCDGVRKFDRSVMNDQVQARVGGRQEMDGTRKPQEKSISNSKRQKSTANSRYEERTYSWRGRRSTSPTLLKIIQVADSQSGEVVITVPTAGFNDARTRVPSCGTWEARTRPDL